MANTGIASLLNAAARVERFLLSRGTSCPLLCTTHADWVGSHNRYNAMGVLEQRILHTSDVHSWDVDIPFQVLIDHWISPGVSIRKGGRALMK